MSDIQRVPVLSPAQQGQVRALAGRLAAESGAPPLNDESLARLGAGADAGVVHLLCGGGAGLAGYAQLAEGTAELAAPPDRVGPLLDAVAAAAGRPLAVWTHGASSPVGPLLAERGYRRVRLLHQLRRPADAPVPDVELAPEVSVRPFVVGRDEDAWLAVNAAAFADHPEQGGWTRADLAAREAEDWFDPAGFFLAWRGERLLGFHWTKVHPAEADADGRSGRPASGDDTGEDRSRSNGPGAGEVYVLGVDPSAQGLRLGAGLLAHGLRHLHERGCPYVLLYVDDANATAVRLYERFGFARHDLDAQWVLG